MVELVGQRSASTAEHSPRGGRQQHRIIGREPIRGQQEDAPRLAERLAGGPGLQFGPKPLGGLAVTLVQDHQIQLQAPTAGICTPLNKLANDGLISGRRDPHQHDGQVTRDGMGPQPRLPQAVRGHGLGLPEPGAREDDGRRQAIEEGDVVRRQRHLPQLVVTAGLGGGECPIDGLEVAELSGDSQRRLPGVGRPGHERDACRRSPARGERGAAS